MAIPKDAPRPNKAHRFINCLRRPEMAAAPANKVIHAKPNAASLKFLQQDVAENKTIVLSEATNET